MPATRFEGKHSDITDVILQGFYKVHRTLGYGFGEKIYQNSMIIELSKLGLQVAEKKEIDVFYDGHHVGEYEVDLLVNDLVIIELKAVKQIIDEHEAQLLNYLKATRMEVGLVLNFGPNAEVRRRVYDNERKGRCRGWIDGTQKKKQIWTQKMEEEIGKENQMPDE